MGVWPAPEKSETLGVTYANNTDIHTCKCIYTVVWPAPEKSKTLGVTYVIQYLHRKHTNENTKKDTLIVTQFLHVFSRLLKKSVRPKMSRNSTELLKQRF